MAQDLQPSAQTQDVACDCLQEAAAGGLRAAAAAEGLRAAAGALQAAAEAVHLQQCYLVEADRVAVNLP